MNGQNVTENANDLKATIGFCRGTPFIQRHDRYILPNACRTIEEHGQSRCAGATPRGHFKYRPSGSGKPNHRHLIPRLQKARRHRHGRDSQSSLVILDEPISGLDPMQIKEMRSVIRKLGKDRAVLISSHILSEMSKTVTVLSCCIRERWWHRAQEELTSTSRVHESTSLLETLSTNSQNGWTDIHGHRAHHQRERGWMYKRNGGHEWRQPRGTHRRLGQLGVQRTIG